MLDTQNFICLNSRRVIAPRENVAPATERAFCFRSPGKARHSSKIGARPAEDRAPSCQYRQPGHL